MVASPRGAARAIAAGSVNLEYVVSAADRHSRANIRRSAQEAVEAIPDIVAVASAAGGECEVIVATAWDCPFDGPTPVERVHDVVDIDSSVGGLGGCRLA